MCTRTATIDAAILSDLRRDGRVNLSAHYPGSNAFLDLIHVPEHGDAVIILGKGLFYIAN